jgi:trimethylamine:corrinoid methyltransferase-like protein
MADVNSPNRATPPYEPLSQADVQRIVQAAHQLMRETGVQFDPDPRVLDLFSDAGCDVGSEGLVKFDPEIVDESLETAARSVEIWDRSGSGFIEIDRWHTWFFTGMTAIHVFDRETGERRPSAREDLGAITRVADALPDIDGASVACKITEHSNVQGEIEEFAELVANTTKPLEYLCESDLALEAAIEMASAVRGGAQCLAEKPYFLQMVTPLPLYLAKAHTDQMIRAIESGIPVSVGTVTIGGASTPMTIAGSLIHGLATDFAAMVLGQRVRRGCFCVGSSDIAFMDPISGSLSGIAQTWSAEAAAAQIINSLGFPSLSRLAGVGSGGDFDPDTVSQATATMIEVFYSRPTTVDLLSMVDGGMTYSLRLLLLCHDLIGMLRTLWKGIRIDDETLALELTRSQGPRASYLAQRHTAKHARLEAWRSRYLAAPGETGAAGDGERGLTERIDAHLAEIVEHHEPEPLPGPLHKELDALLKKYGALPLR